MKIKAVKVYQAVSFGKKLITYFSEVNPALVNTRLQFEMLSGVGVLISSGEEHIIVPYPNIALIEVLKEEKKLKKAE